MDWVRLCSKFEHPLEKDFFIDMSDKSYPIFETHFFFFEPYRWYKKFLSKDISEILLATDENIDLDSLLEENEAARWNQVKGFFQERKNLAFQGKLFVKEIAKEELLFDSDCKMNMKYNPKDSELSVMGITPLILGLLPYTTKIGVSSMECKYGGPINDLSSIKNIRDLTFIVRSSGFRRISSYKAEFEDFTTNYVDYEDGKIIIKSSENKLLEIVLKSFGIIGSSDHLAPVRLQLAYLV
jgi:hypothetical protein